MSPESQSPESQSTEPQPLELQPPESQSADSQSTGSHAPLPSGAPDAALYDQPSRSDRRKIVLPILVLVVGIVATVLMVQARPDVEKEPVEVPPPLVRVLTVEPVDLRLDVTSQGTVTPRTEAQVVSEVAGRVRSVSPRFEAGGFFRQGETLLEIDARDYELAVASAQAQRAQAQVTLAREQAEADVAREEWRELGRGEADPLVLRVPQLAEAEARLASADAAVAKAELDLERTKVTAPFTGRVRATRVDLGEFVSRGTPLATLYSVDEAEIRLPVPDPELAFLDLPAPTGESSGRGPAVELSTEFAGRVHRWSGRVVRTEAEIDPQTRMVYLVARVQNPYRLTDEQDVPLAVGLFVGATIEGRTYRDVVRLPREALHGEATVAVVDADDRIRLRPVGLLRAGVDDVVVSDGLERGERVLLSTLDTLVDGMKVRVADEGAPWSERGSEPLAIDRSASGRTGSTSEEARTPETEAAPVTSRTTATGEPQP